MKKSAGLLLFRRKTGALEVFLVHPGGPFWAKKDLASWSIPKGEYDDDDEPLKVAQREFEEETGQSAPTGEFRSLRTVKQPGGKVVSAWAIEGDCDSENIRSNTFQMEWPPQSGRRQEFPEVDKAAWFTLDIARQKLLKGQAPFLDELEELLD